MEKQEMIIQLDVQGQAILILMRGLTEEALRWKPTTSSWSMLEVLNHLVDEEIYDFRAHLDHILHTTNLPWPEIDPQGWVTQQQYNQRPLDESLANFESERKASIAWLKTLSEPNWKSSVEFSWGNLSAGDMLASWVAHDLLHLRQLIELRYQLSAKFSQPFSVTYAGKW